MTEKTIIGFSTKTERNVFYSTIRRNNHANLISLKIQLENKEEIPKTSLSYLKREVFYFLPKDTSKSYEDINNVQTHHTKSKDNSG